MSFPGSLARSRLQYFASSSCRQNFHRCRLLSSGRKDLPPPLPPKTASANNNVSPSQAKKEYLKSKAKVLEQDPVAKMANLQKELDIVRERAAQKLEKKLQKSVYRRLTDPLRRHHHSMINVGAVLLAYILAHNLYQTSKKAERTSEDLAVAQAKADSYHAALKNILEEATLEEMANACATETKITGSPREGTSSWFGASTKVSGRSISSERIYHALERELRQRIEEHILTDEERHVKNQQQAWKESQNQPVTQRTSPEQALLAAVLQEDPKARDEVITSEAQMAGTKKQKRVFSM